MPRQTPDHRGRRVLELAASGKPIEGGHPSEVALFYLVKSGEVQSKDVEEAYCAYLDPDSAHVLNALILGKATDAEIQEALEVPEGVLQAYRHLFFDRGVFRHALDVIKYVRELGCGDPYHKYYKTAIEKGPMALANRFRVGERPGLDPRQVLKNLMHDKYDKFLSHRGHELTQNIAKEALKWGQAAAHAAALVIDKGGDEKRNALSELRLVLETRDLTQTPEQAGVDPTEVLS